ncbi:uncharacterized protein FPRO_13832 [Fusarium proliferatum ET1]|uniref:Uncharacterized protein n=1 Tax=Fusarium proliferatum (strain ET1) TaxID=1227346 RepID=A0A1L7VUG9_FUSPR|nr:uncharacterized protein FPRO_13832 [Fusarium proliferatum ET1]CZR44024.1 uncharacterized protein FPRO_13832 [Fusarium proliferatum ET1]
MPKYTAERFYSSSTKGKTYLTKPLIDLTLQPVAILGSIPARYYTLLLSMLIIYAVLLKRSNQVPLCRAVLLLAANLASSFGCLLP